MDKVFARVGFSKRYQVAVYQTEEIQLELQLDITGKTKEQAVVYMLEKEAELELQVLSRLVMEGYEQKEEYERRKAALIRHLDYIKKLNGIAE